MSLVDELIARVMRTRPDAYHADDRLSVSMGELRALVSAALEVRGVPREPTQAMWTEGERMTGRDAYTVGDIWRAMLDAAPAKGDTPSVVRDALRDAAKAMLAYVDSIDPANFSVLLGGISMSELWRRIEAIRAALAPAGEPAVPDKGTL